jgi:lysophospholipase L1-like esterase
MKHLPLLFLLLFVFATAQLHADGPVDLKSIHKILILGDSITHHSPAPQLAWTGDWGMAATAADKDYVHLFLARLAAAQGPGAPAPDVWIFGEGGGKTTDKVPFVDKITAYKADLALIQLGENDRDITATGFQQPYEKLLAAVKAGNPNVRILCVGVWGVWPSGDHTKDTVIRDACLKYGATYADLGAAFADPATHAAAEHLFTNVGVNWHPSDAGMVAYANAFWQALTGAPAASTSPVPDAGGTAATPAPADTSSGANLYEVDENWGDPLALTWSSTPPIAQENGHNVAKITSTTPAGATFGTRLKVSEFAGHEAIVHTRVKSDSISDPPNPWNGVKIMFTVVNAEGKTDYPEFRLPTGTYDWTEVNWTVKIPENAVTMDFIIGLEKVTGTVYYDPIQISAK